MNKQLSLSLERIGDEDEIRPYHRVALPNDKVTVIDGEGSKVIEIADLKVGDEIVAFHDSHPCTTYRVKSIGPNVGDGPEKMQASPNYFLPHTGRVADDPLFNIAKYAADFASRNTFSENRMPRELLVSPIYFILTDVRTMGLEAAIAHWDERLKRIEENNEPIAG